MELVEAGRQAKVGQLDMPTAIEQDVIGFNISAVGVSARNPRDPPLGQVVDLPVNEAQLVNGIDGEDNLGNIEARNILGKDLVLDQHGHQIATRQELHQHV